MRAAPATSFPTPLRLAGLALGLAALAACGGSGAETQTSTPAERIGPVLELPVDCVIGETCAIQNYVDRDPGPGVRDYACGGRTYQDHNGLDIRTPDMAAQRAGVNVLAAADGQVVRLRDGVADVSVRAAGLAAVEGAECGNGVVIDHGGGWETQYCHLAQGSLQAAVGDRVRAGQPIGRIGLSGQTEYPHLHFTVRRDGAVVDPFAPAAGEGRVCEPSNPLWSDAAQAALAYQTGAVLNAGFSAGAVTLEAVEEAAVTPPAAHAPALVAYVRAIALEAGDVQHLRLTAPDGAVLAETRIDPLESAKAQYLTYVGRRTPSDGWPSGRYLAEYMVDRAGRRLLTHSFHIEMSG